MDEKKHNESSSFKFKLGQRPVSANSSELFQAFLAHYKKEEGDWEVLVGRFTKGKHRNFQAARSIILDIHLRLDLLLSITIEYLLIIGSDSLSLKPKIEKLLETLSQLEIGRRIKIIANLGVLSAESLGVINAINNIRKAFVHVVKENSEAFNYNGESIFTLKGIRKVVDDFEKTRGGVLKILEKELNKDKITTASDF